MFVLVLHRSFNPESVDADMVVVLVLHRGFNSRSVDGRHGGCVGSTQRFQF